MRRRLSAAWIATCLAVLGVLFFAGSAQAVHDLQFQLDGDVFTEPCLSSVPNCLEQTEDWASFFDANGQKISGSTGPTRLFTNSDFVRDFSTNADETFNSADPTTFTNGSKDIQDISEWHCANSNNVGGKVDIMNAYSLGYTTAGPNPHKILYFGLEKNTPNGTSNVGFWFLQGNADCSSGGTAQFTGHHTVGDVLVVSEFSSGGGVSTISAYKWVGGSNPLALIAAGGDCKVPKGHDVICATTNSGSRPVTGPIQTPWQTADKAGVGHTVEPADFFEGGIDLTEAFKGAPPSCFSTFLADTRASTSQTSTLFDYAGGSFANCSARIKISPETAVNEVNKTHILTVTVETRNGGAFMPTAGAHVTVTLTAPPNGATPSFIGPPTCTTGSDGTCTVSFTSSTTGVVTAHASAIVTFADGSTTTVQTDGQDENSGDATKRFVDGTIAVSPLTAVNEVNQKHTVTATVQQNDGLPAGAPGDGVSGFGPVPDGTLVTFTLPSNAADASFVNGENTCTTTNGTGTCSIQIESSKAGSVEIQATTAFSVGGVTLTRATGTASPGAPNSANAIKKYVDANVQITPTSKVNEVGNEHTFTITTTAFPAGTTPALVSITPSVLPEPESKSSTCTSPSGSGNTRTCTVKINSSSAGSFTANATVVWKFTEGGNTVSVTRSTSGNNSGPEGTGSATKRFVNGRIAVSPLTAVNEVNQQHTVTAIVEQDDGLPAGAPGDGVSGFGPVPDGTLVTFTLPSNAAEASFVNGANTCTTTNGTGTCSIKITSSKAGSVKIHAVATFSVGGVTLTPRATGTGGLNSADATKQYVDANVQITPPTAVNPVGREHTFTIKTTAFPAGATPRLVSITPSVEPKPESEPQPAQPCTNPTVNGNTRTCEVTINSNTPGIFTANAKVVWEFKEGSNTVLVTRSTSGDSGPEGTGAATKEYVSLAIETQQKLVISDFAKPEGFQGVTPTGTVTFKLFRFTTPGCSGTPLCCSGTPLYVSPTPVTLDVNGVAQTTVSSKLELKENGTYGWVAEYSGDANNLPSTSECTELTTISGNTPGIVAP